MYDVGVVRGVVARIRGIRLIYFRARAPLLVVLRDGLLVPGEVRALASFMFVLEDAARLLLLCCHATGARCEAVARAGDVLDGVDCRRVTLGLFPRRDGCRRDARG